MLAPAVIVHGREDARAALRAGRPVTLLSAPGAALYGGARWWRLVVEGAAADAPGLLAADILDCGGEAGRAVEALREGCRRILLDPALPAFADVAERAAALGAVVLSCPPPALDIGALDLRQPGAQRRLAAWLDGMAAFG